MKLPILIILAIFASVFVPKDALSSETDVKIRFSGGSYETMIDGNDDGVFAQAGSVQMKGTFGQGTSETVFEFTQLLPGSTPGCAVESVFVQESHVAMYKDGSMIFFVGKGGSQCLDDTTFELTAVFWGDITGGTGRFEGATGSWTIDTYAVPVGDFMAAIGGTLTGTMVRPD